MVWDHHKELTTSTITTNTQNNNSETPNFAMNPNTLHSQELLKHKEYLLSHGKGQAYMQPVFKIMEI